MAEVQQKSSAQGSNRQRKRSTRIDMTAMVDVAFLLLTFFILTTTLATPSALQVTKPTTEGPGTEVKCSKMLEIYPGIDGKVYWYAGCDRSTISTTDFSDQGIRKVIREHLAADPELVITLKPTPAATFASMVDVLDEMKITGAPRYALAPLAPEDLDMLSLNSLK